VSTERCDPGSSNHLPTTDSLREAIHTHLLSLGFSKNSDGYFVDGELTKQRIRDLHSGHRREVLERNRSFVETHGPELVHHFATGTRIDPASIDPELVEVKPDSLESRLFRFVSLLWSVPVSQGFGRRLRFLVRDRQNGCLIGLFALGDPVFNLSARDNWIGWTHKDRSQRLVHVMDAYVVGALPPYSFLIGGKLVAALNLVPESGASHHPKPHSRTSPPSFEELWRDKPEKQRKCRWQFVCSSRFLQFDGS